MTPQQRTVRDRFASVPERLGVAARAASPEPPAPGEWPPTDVVRHLIAVEEEVWQPRLRQLIDEDEPRWPWAEPDRWPGSPGASLDELLAVHADRRAATVALLDAPRRRGLGAVRRARGLRPPRRGGPDAQGRQPRRRAHREPRTLMPGSADVVTRRVRDAANATALAVVAFAVLWFVTTQVRAVRDVSPFAEDPWDLVASFAALFLPLIVAATFVRSVAHRGPLLEKPVARRIAIGSGSAVAIVAAAVTTDIGAIVTSAEWPGSGGPERGLILWLVLMTAVITGFAAAFVTGAGLALRRPGTVDFGTAPEPMS